MSHSLNSHAPMKEEEKHTLIPLTKVMKDSFSLLPKMILPYIVIIFLSSLFVAILLATVYFPTEYSYFAHITHIKEEGWDPSSSTLTEEQVAYLQETTILMIYRIMYNSMFEFIPLLLSLLLMTGKIYYEYTGDEEEGSTTWKDSLKKPFQTKNKIFTSLFLLLFLSIFIPLGLFLLYLPGIFLFSYQIFDFHALIIDENEGLKVLKGGIYYAKENIRKVIGLMFITIFFPLFIHYYVFTKMFFPLIGMTTEYYQSLILSPSPSYFKIIQYLTLYIFVQDVLFFMVPISFTVLFYHIREKKIYELQQKEKTHSLSLRDSLGKVDVSIEENSKGSLLRNQKNKQAITKIEVEPSAKYFYCHTCGKKLPINSKKCPKCGTLYSISFKNK